MPAINYNYCSSVCFSFCKVKCFRRSATETISLNLYTVKSLLMETKNNESAFMKSTSYLPTLNDALKPPLSAIFSPRVSFPLICGKHQSSRLRNFCKISRFFNRLWIWYLSTFEEIGLGCVTIASKDDTSSRRRALLQILHECDGVNWLPRGAHFSLATANGHNYTDNKLTTVNICWKVLFRFHSRLHLECRNNTENGKQLRPKHGSHKIPKRHQQPVGCFHLPDICRGLCTSSTDSPHILPWR